MGNKTKKLVFIPSSSFAIKLRYYCSIVETTINVRNKTSLIRSEDVKIFIEKIDSPSPQATEDSVYSV